MEHHFPKGLRVLVVDDDATCLKLACRMLQYCNYTVTSCTKPTDALSILREQNESFDLVITDVQMPEMDGFKLLERIMLERDIPVIMMSAHDEEETMMKGLTNGVSFYLVKPIKIDQIKNIWQYVIRKRQTKETYELVSPKKVAGAVEECAANSKTQGESRRSINHINGVDVSKRKRSGEYNIVASTTITDGGGSPISSAPPPMQRKKPRVLWNNQLHDQFINAVNRIGIDRAIPKRILEIMRTPGLTRENVASHLQKYRLYLKKVQESRMNAVTGTESSNKMPTKSIFGSIPSQVMIHSMQRQRSPFTSYFNSPSLTSRQSSIQSYFATPNSLSPIDKQNMSMNSLLRNFSHGFVAPPSNHHLEINPTTDMQFESLPGRQFNVQPYLATPNFNSLLLTNNQMLSNSQQNFNQHAPSSISNHQYLTINPVDETQFSSRYHEDASCPPHMMMNDNTNQLTYPQQQYFPRVLVENPQDLIVTNPEITMNEANQIRPELQPQSQQQQQFFSPNNNAFGFVQNSQELSQFPYNGNMTHTGNEAIDDILLPDFSNLVPNLGNFASFVDSTQPSTEQPMVEPARSNDEGLYDMAQTFIFPDGKNSLKDIFPDQPDGTI